MDQKLLQYQIERTFYDLQKRRRITDCKSPVTYILNNQLITHKKNGKSRIGSDRVILSIQGEVQRTGSNTPQQMIAIGQTANLQKTYISEKLKYLIVILRKQITDEPIIYLQQ